MYDDFKDQINEAKKGNALLLGSNREIRRLPLYLHEGETVHKIITGSPGKHKGRGIVVATSDRVLFIKDGWIFRTVQDFPYETISSVEFKTGIFFGMFVMYGKGDETAYNWVGRVAGAEFAKAVRREAAAFKRTTTTSPATGAISTHSDPTYAEVPTPATLSPQQALMEQLRDIKKLYDEGIINLDEYEIKKQEIMSRM